MIKPKIITSLIYNGIYTISQRAKIASIGQTTVVKNTWLSNKKH